MKNIQPPPAERENPEGSPVARRAEALRQTARALGISDEAVSLLESSDVIDLHLDTFIPPRLPFWRYDLHERHAKTFLRGRFFGHLDIPRLLDSGLTGGMWSITTNPFRSAKRRWQIFERNSARFQEMVARSEGKLRLVRGARAYREARADGAHAILLSIQGGNALEAAPEGLASVDRLWGPGEAPVLNRVTLVHLTNSVYGITSSPFRLWKGGRGLTDAGRALVEALNEARIFVDLAHINPKGFWDAVEVHAKDLPILATHTGVSGVKRHWRNLDDKQLKTVADSGGVTGIIFAKTFLKTRGGPDDVGMVVRHIQHAIDVGGAESVAIGSDYDGAIVPPRDMRQGEEAYLRLTQRMLDEGMRPEVVQGVLGGNFLRTLERMRPGL